MKDTHEPATEPLTPLEVIRNAYRAMEIAFDEDEDTVITRLHLDHVEVHVISWGEPDDLASIVVRLPVRAAPPFRPAAGEFLHRLNFDSRRKFWEIDHDDGEIRLAGYTDTVNGSLTDRTFRGMLHCLLITADTVFPYLTSVLAGRMSPEFAHDQAAAALLEMWGESGRRDSCPPPLGH